MREIKTELVSSKKLVEQLSTGKTSSDLETKKRQHQIDQVVLRYRNIKAFHDNPDAGIVNLQDIENEMQQFKEQRGIDGEYSYTRKLDDKELLKQFAQRDKNFTGRMTKNADGVQSLKHEAEL